MGLEKHVSTPAAILLGSGLIAAGLYFGQQRDHEAGPPPASASVPDLPGVAGPALPAARASAAPGAATAPSQPPPQPLVEPPALAKNEVARRASAALEAQRAQLVERCWKPAVAKIPEPVHAKLVFSFSFDAGGAQTGRGVVEDRATSRADVTACVLSTLQPLSIPPPGAGAFVEVPFSLP